MTEEERRLDARKRIAKARQKQALQLSGENDLLPPRADDPSYSGKQPSKSEDAKTNFRTEFSQPGIDLMRQSSYQGGGVVDVPDEMPLYNDEGFKIKFAPAIQKALEFVGDVGVFGLGAVEAGAGYVVGAVADIMVEAGVNPSTANRFARDVMAMPEAFAGSPSQLIRGGKKIAKSKLDDTVETFTQKEKDALRTEGVYLGDVPIENPLSAKEIGELLKVASAGTTKSQAAIEKLAKEAKTNPEVQASAERLGIDLPPDVLSDNPLVKNAASLTRGIKNSEASAQFEIMVRDASQVADEAISALGGSPDIASVSDKVFRNLTTARESLKKVASDLYDAVDLQVPKSTLVSPNNSIKLLNTTIEELGGIKNLSSKEKILLEKITNPDSPLTYAALIRLKQDIGRAIKSGQGEYGDVNQGALKRIYGALAEDQLLTVEKVGGESLRSQLLLANQATAKQKAFEKNITKSFGEDLEGSIASKLKQSISSASRGDVGNLNRILKSIPKDLQKESLITAINVLSLPGGATDLPFGFAEYAKVIKGLQKNKPIYKKIVSVLGDGSDQFLTDLLNVSQRITEARGRIDQTGKANQALILEGLTSETLAKKVLDSTLGKRVIQGAATGGGMVAGGPAVGVASGALSDILMSLGKTDRVSAAGNLLNSAAFRSLVDADFSANQVALQSALDKLENSPAFKRWLRSVEMEPAAGKNFLQTSIVVSGESGVTPEPVVEEEVDASLSPALQSLIQTTDPSLLNQIN
tara:strand:- start:1127 stop:3388 length:2262 start_codon:yes stop_codon:yes gene_type:complete